MNALFCVVLLISQVFIPSIVAPESGESYESREPESFTRNVGRLGIRTMKTAGDTLENFGGLLTGTVRLVHDLHKAQASYTNDATEQITGIGPLVRLANTGISWGFRNLRYGVKTAIKHPGKKLVKYAAEKKGKFKEDKEQTPTEKEKNQRREPPKKKPPATKTPPDDSSSDDE